MKLKCMNCKTIFGAPDGITEKIIACPMCQNAVAIPFRGFYKKNIQQNNSFWHEILNAFANSKKDKHSFWTKIVFTSLILSPLVFCNWFLSIIAISVFGIPILLALWVKAVRETCIKFVITAGFIVVFFAGCGLMCSTNNFSSVHYVSKIERKAEMKEKLEEAYKNEMDNAKTVFQQMVIQNQYNIILKKIDDM